MNPADLAALELQRLHRNGRIRSDQSLLRIDPRPESARAPLCFDIAGNKLHRSGCDTIPPANRDALYYFEEVGPELRKLECQKCRPNQVSTKRIEPDTSTDLIYGLLSIVDQFGSVLKQRGEEFRKSARGRVLTKSMRSLVATLDRTQRETLNITLASLDGLLKIVTEVNSSLERQARTNNNGHKSPGRSRSNGHNGK